jgi:hypothetical protein
VLGGVWFRESFWVLWAFCVFELFLALLCHFDLVCRFSYLLLVLRVFLLLNDLLELFLTFGLLAVLHGVLDSNFKFCVFCCQWTYQGEDWETKWSVPWFHCDESLTCHGLNSNLRHFRDSTLYLCSGGESRLLVSWCSDSSCNMAGSDEDRGRSRRPGVENRGWSSTGRVPGGRAIMRSGDTVCGLYRAHGDE